MNHYFKIMKTITYIISIVILVVLNSCSTKSSDHNKGPISSNDQSSNLVLNEQKKELINCQKLEMENENSGGPIIVEVCEYGKVKIEKKGYPNYKGQYSYETTIFLKDDGGRFTKTTNSGIFNDKSPTLQKMINLELKKKFEEFSESNPSCFEGITFTPVRLDEIEISMEDDDFIFSKDFGLCSACLALDGASISISLNSMQKFLK
jgi:hypothetical protein